MFSDSSKARLTLVIPTLNEAPNIAELVFRLGNALKDIPWDVIFVDDDSTDGTRDIIHSLAMAGAPVRCLHRIGRKGLSSACLEGILATDAEVVAVMDADLQHDESLLPAMYEAVVQARQDVVVGSRYVAGGGVGDWSAGRQTVSRLATWIARALTHVEISDPMSGFFALKREALMPALHRCSGLGFKKLLLDLLLSSPQPLRVQEIPFHFRLRQGGESKLTSAVAWQLILLILENRLGWLLPARFVSFALVGALGTLVHMAVLSLCYKHLAMGFLWAQSAATGVAMTSNFFLNNSITYSDCKLRGWKLLRGWLSFVAACSVGGMANVGIAELLYRQEVDWMASAIAGVLVGAVWNYAITKLYTWRQK